MNGSYQKFITYGKQVYSGLQRLRTFRLSFLRKVFSLMGRKEKIAVLTLLAIALVSLWWSARNFYYNHTTAAPAWGGEYVEGVRGQPLYINPLLAYQEPDLSLTKLVFSGLYKYDDEGNLLPDLADGLPQISPDQKQYTINLKRDVKWHNDKPFTADDVVFTVQILQDPAYKSPSRGQWLSTTVEKLSDFQVKFTTKDISSPFIHNLTLPILSRSSWSKVEPQNFQLTELNLKEAVGNGPYLIKKITKLKSGKIQAITLESFSNYYSGKPKLDNITVKFYDSNEDLLNAFRSREIQGFGYSTFSNGFELDVKKNNTQIFTALLPQYQVVFFNLHNKILAEQNVRTALATATDRQTIIQKIFKSQASLPYSPLLANFGEKILLDKPAADLAEAEKILEAAGWKIDSKTNLRTKKNQTLQLNLATNDSAFNSKVAEDLISQWQKLNIKVDLTVLPSKQLNDALMRPRTFDVLLYLQKFGADPDPFSFWHSSQTKDPGLNLTGFENELADKLITEARTTTNTATKEAKYQQLNNLLSEKIPTIFLNQAQYFYVTGKEIKNVKINSLYEPSQRFYDLPNWYIEERRVWK